MAKDVGPVLRMSDDIDAIMGDNPGKQISMVDGGAYTRISCEGELRVTRGIQPAAPWS